MSITVRGINDCINQLNAMIDDIQSRRVVRAIQSSLIVGASQAALYTPIDTSNLINSQFREMRVNGTLITGRVGYSANYARYVADPDIPMNFRRSTAQKDFLNKGFEDTRELRESIIRREMGL